MSNEKRTVLNNKYENQFIQLITDLDAAGLYNAHVTETPQNIEKLLEIFKKNTAIHLMKFLNYSLMFTLFGCYHAHGCWDWHVLHCTLIKYIRSVLVDKNDFTEDQKELLPFYLQPDFKESMLNIQPKERDFPLGAYMFGQDGIF